MRKRLTFQEAELLGFKYNKPLKNENKSRYTLTNEEWNKILEFRNKGILEACRNTGVDPSSTPMLWLKTKKETVRVTNPLYVEPQIKEIELILEDAIDSILKRFQYKKKDFKLPKLKLNKKALKATTSDDHLGLEPNPNGKGLFQYEYNAKIYKESYIKLYSSIIKEYSTHGCFDLLLLDNLGDEQDGWNSLTTRGGHELPQNMSNTEVFETCVDTKINLIKSLINANVCNKIILRKVVNDNHSGDFGHTINITVKKIINMLYSTDLVEVETLTRFLEHRIYGDHCFILTHGKDTKQMFKGLPLQLNDKTINFINDYIKHYNINSKFIHVEKGDLHQIGYNKCSTFDYRNFMSFAPPSSWVQHNFGDCYSGYSIQIIPKHSNEISHTDYFLDYKKVIY